MGLSPKYSVSSPILALVCGPFEDDLIGPIGGGGCVRGEREEG